MPEEDSSHQEGLGESLRFVDITTVFLLLAQQLSPSKGYFMRPLVAIAGMTGDLTGRACVVLRFFPGTRCQGGTGVRSPAPALLAGQRQRPLPYNSQQPILPPPSTPLICLPVPTRR